MIRENKKTETKKSNQLVEDIDYYFEDGLLVLTAYYLNKRGYCCGNGCRHCPYSEKEKIKLQKKSI